MKKFKYYLGALLIVTNIYGEDFDTFDDSFSFGGEVGVEESSKLHIGGNIQLENRIITPVDRTKSMIDLDLDLSYERDNSDFFAKIKYDEEDNIEIDEAYLRVYYNSLTLEAGRIKNVWGKGDMIHPVDFMNSMDMSDLFNPTYAERTIGEDMIKLSYNTSGEGKYTFAYAPNFKPNNLELENGNPFTPSLVQNIYNAGLLNESQIRDALSNGDDYDNGQYALRYTNSKNGTDYGFTLYRGYDKTANLAGINMLSMVKNGHMGAMNYALSNGYINGTEVDFDKIKGTVYTENYAFGSEFSRVLFGLNTKGEFAYRYTEDTKGDNPMIPNNSIELLLGFDKDLGLSNINFNFQWLGKYILNADNAKENLNKYGFDANTSFSGEVNELSNMLVFTISDKFKYDTILPESQFIYQVEDESFIFINSVEFKLKDDISLTTGYNWHYGDANSTFGQYDNADFAFAKFEYNF